MSTIAPRQFTANNGAAFTVRAAQAADAARLLAFTQTVGREAAYLLTQPDEFTQDIDTQTSWVQAHLDAPGQIVLVADAAGALAGLLSFENGHRRRSAHQGTLGMSVRAPWRGIGVGTALLQCLVDWAEANPLIEKLGLAVFADNRPAIGLYRKFGFLEEGRQPRQIKLGPGDYQDLILMYRFVKRDL